MTMMMQPMMITGMTSVVHNASSLVMPVIGFGANEFRIEDLELVGKEAQYFFIVLYSLTAAFALLGNVAAIVVLTRGKRTSRNLSKYLINLSLSDILMSLFSIPFTYTNFIMGRWIFPPETCPLVQSMQVWSVFVSIYTLTIIGADRYFAITRPFVKSVWSKSFATIVVTATWLIGFMLSMIIWFYSEAVPLITISQQQPQQSQQQSIPQINIDQRNRSAGVEKMEIETMARNVTFYECREVWRTPADEQLYTVTLFLIVFAIPLVCLVFVYGSITVKLWSHLAPGNRDAARDCAQSKAKRKVINMLITCCVLFAICWFPTHLFQLIRAFHKELLLDWSSNDASNPRYLAMVIVSHWLAMSNSFVNPIIYCFMSDNFRVDFKNVVKHLLTWPCWSCQNLFMLSSRFLLNPRPSSPEAASAAAAAAARAIIVNNKKRKQQQQQAPPQQLPQIQQLLQQSQPQPQAQQQQPRQSNDMDESNAIQLYSFVTERTSGLQTANFNQHHHQHQHHPQMNTNKSEPQAITGVRENGICDGILGRRDNAGNDAENYRPHCLNSQNNNNHHHHHHQHKHKQEQNQHHHIIDVGDEEDDDDGDEKKLNAKIASGTDFSVHARNGRKRKRRKWRKTNCSGNGDNKINEKFQNNNNNNNHNCIYEEDEDDIICCCSCCCNNCNSSSSSNSSSSEGFIDSNLTVNSYNQSVLANLINIDAMKQEEKEEKEDEEEEDEEEEERSEKQRLRSPSPLSSQNNRYDRNPPATLIGINL